MYLRISFARFLLRLSEWITALPVLVMRPDDLVEFSRQTYAKGTDVESWSEDALVDSGLSGGELELMAFLPVKTGTLLLLGVGGGREAISLAQKGYLITGVDFVTEMVDRAKKNANRRGINIAGLVQEISQLDVPKDTYDVVWLSRAMYSSVPTRSRRIAMVRRIANSLRPGGVFVCQFLWNPGKRLSWVGLFVRRLIAVLTLGNIGYEEGDMLWYNIEFIHVFQSEDEVRSEIEEGGLSVVYIRANSSSSRAGVICMKHAEPEPEK